MAKDFITDEEMNKMEGASAPVQDSSPDFLSDDDMNAMESGSAPIEALKTIGGTAIGAGTGYGAGVLANKGFDAALPLIGELNKQQIDTISSNPKAYKTATPLETILDNWKSLSQKTQRTGIDSASNARKALEGKPNIPADSIFEALSKETSNPKYSTPIDVGTKSSIFAEGMDKLRPEVEALKGRRGEIASRLAELEKLKETPISDKGINLREVQNNRKYDRDMASPSNVDQSKLNFKKLQADEKLDLAKSKKQESYLAGLLKEQEKLKNEDTSILDRIGKQSDKTIKDSRNKYSKIANIPEELNLDDRFLRPEYSEQATDAVSKIRPAKNTGVEPQVLDQIIQEMRQGINYDAQGDKVKDFNKGMARDVRDVLGQAVPEYDVGMKKSSALQDLQDKIEASTKVQYDKSPDNIRFTDSARNNLGKTLLAGSAGDPSLKNSKEELSSIVQDMAKHGIIDDATAKTLIQNGELSALKDFVQNSNTKLSLGDAADIATPSSWMNKLSKLGTKGQGKLAEFAPTIKKGSKGLGLGLGTIIGGLAGAAAADDNTGATDFIPGLDQADTAGSALDDNMIKSELKGLKDYEKSPAALDSDNTPAQRLQKLQQNYNSPKVNQLEQTNQSMEQDLAKADPSFQQGFAYKQAQSSIAKNKAEIERLSGNSSPVVDGGKALNKSSPDQLMELSKSFANIKGADNFVAPLENAAQASSDEERKARLFGLYQQPAFRQLLKKGKIEES